MSIRDDDLLQRHLLCAATGLHDPRPDGTVEPATDHERDRTGCAWWCTSCHQLFTGTATEYQRIRARVTADQAERMTTFPKEQR